MKHAFYLLVALLLTSFSSLGQGLISEKGSNYSYNSRSVGVVANTDGYFAVSSVNFENSFFTKVIVEYFDNQHVLQWSRVLFEGFNPLYYEYTAVTSLSASPDGGLYILAASGGCDYMIYRRTFLLKINPQGLISELKAYGPTVEDDGEGNVEDYLGEMLLTGLSILPDSTITMCYSQNNETNHLLKVEESGILADSIELTATESFIGFGATANWYSLGFSENRIMGIAPDGTATTLRTFSSAISAFAQSEDALFIATNDSLYKIANDSTILLATALQHPVGVKKLRLDGLGIACIQYSGGTVSLIRLDENLQEISSEPFTGNFQSVAAADYASDHMAVSEDYELTYFYGVRNLLFKRNDPSGISLERADAGVTSFEVVDQVVTQVHDSPPIYQVNMHLKATVVNESTLPIHSVWINYKIQQLPACNYQYYRAYFSNLNILPGQSQELDLVNINTHVVGAPVSNVCLYSSFVNGIADLNVQNDEFCQNVYHVGIDEFETGPLTVYPNPSAGKIAIVLKTNETVGFAICSSNGAVVQEGTHDFTTPLTVNLAAGLYLVTVTTPSGGQYTERIVVQQ